MRARQVSAAAVVAASLAACCCINYCRDSPYRGTATARARVRAEGWSTTTSDVRVWLGCCHGGALSVLSQAGEGRRHPSPRHCLCHWHYLGGAGDRTEASTGARSDQGAGHVVVTSYAELEGVGGRRRCREGGLVGPNPGISPWPAHKRRGSQRPPACLQMILVEAHVASKISDSPARLALGR